MNTPTPSAAPASPQPSQWERSTTRRCFRWVFSIRTLRRAALALVWIATLVALLYAEENWRGRRAWNSYRRDITARGEKLELKAFVPEPISEEQNFAATRFIKEWFIRKNVQERWDDPYARADVKNLSRGDEHPREFLDLVAWGNAMKMAQTDSTKRVKLEKGSLDARSRTAAAPAVLDGLEESEANLNQLQAVASRPSAQYPVDYNLENPWGILLPHLINVRLACQRLQLRACARLAAGQSDQALADVRLMLRLTDSLRSEIFLVSFVVRVTCLHLTMQPVWEGLAEHRWSDAQLQELQARFERYDFLTDFKLPRDAERAAIVLTAELLYRQKYRLTDLSESTPGSPRWAGGDELANLLGRWAPRGWFYLEQVNACRIYDNQSAAFDLAQKRISPGLLEARDNEREFVKFDAWPGREFHALIHHRLLESLLVPSLARLPSKAAAAQTAVDQASLACALERYRLAAGAFPEKLEALVPKFMAQLPKDVLTGAPYLYRRTADDQFVLYSVGWNEKDDGGTSGPGLFDGKEGDWVWSSR